MTKCQQINLSFKFKFFLTLSLKFSKIPVMKFFAENFLIFSFLPAVYLFLCVIYFYKSKKTVDKFIKSGGIGAKNIFKNFSFKKALVKKSMLIVSIIFLFISLLRPSGSIKQTVINVKSPDIIFLLDVSNSMLADDVKPNRLQISKDFIKSFSKKRFKTDRLGIILFADSAFTLCPLTKDADAFFTLLDSADVSSVSSQGTNLLNALELADFTENNSKKNIFVLISDGEDFGQISQNSNLQNSKLFNSKIFCAGIGTKSGANIKINSNTIVKDDSGKPVITRLNETFLKKIAGTSKAEYYGLQENNIITVAGNLNSEINKINEPQKKILITSDSEYYEFFLIAAILLIITESFISIDKKNFRVQTHK